MESLLERAYTGGAIVELFHTSQGYECMLTYLGQARYSTVHITEAEGRARFDACCARWMEAAERDKETHLYK